MEACDSYFASFAKIDASAQVDDRRWLVMLAQMSVMGSDTIDRYVAFQRGAMHPS
jgi:hypothetical protein